MSGWPSWPCDQRGQRAEDRGAVAAGDLDDERLLAAAAAGVVDVEDDRRRGRPTWLSGVQVTSPVSGSTVMPLGAAGEEEVDRRRRRGRGRRRRSGRAGRPWPASTGAVSKTGAWFGAGVAPAPGVKSTRRSLGLEIVERPAGGRLAGPEPLAVGELRRQVDEPAAVRRAAGGALRHALVALRRVEDQHQRQEQVERAACW